MNKAIKELQLLGQQIFPLLDDTEHLLSTLFAVAEWLNEASQAGARQAAFSQFVFLWVTCMFIPTMDENIQMQG